jgi:cytochrome oxidase assembly protein ShyY1
MALSYWQLSRAYEKQQKLALFIDNKITNESLYDSLNKDINALNGREVSISGYFNTQYIWYLDNQILDGRVGVDILTLFKPQQ